jgi:glycosyltransferase involved in cell wall biosynthesis
VRLVFMGGSDHPAAREALGEARAVADASGLAGSAVFFNDSWVPYAERSNWLLDASCAISTHRDHLETRFAFRTRVLDCFWAGLPVVCTRGDDLADMVDRRDLGAAVAPGEPEATADALERVLERGRPAYAEGLAAAAREHTWERVAEPIARWVTAGEPVERRRASRAPGHRLRAALYGLARPALGRRHR